MAHAIGLAACAAGSTWAGHLVASQQSLAKPVFVPGSGPHFGQLATWDESLFDPTVMAIGAHEPLMNGSAETKAYASPIRIGKWGTIASLPIDLPTYPVQVALFELEIRFNCEPGAAWVRAEVQLNESGHWKQLQKFQNRFGGSYDFPYQCSVPSSLLANATSIRFRLGAMTVRSTPHPDGLPPIGLRMFTTPSPYQIGSLSIWKDLNRPEGIFL